MNRFDILRRVGRWSSRRSILSIIVNWSASHTASLRLDFSADSGITWETVARDLGPASGAHTFAAPSTPTKFALVRLVDPVRQNLVDISDRHFEILPGKSIAIFTPPPGDQLTRNSQMVITWDAQRLKTVDIYYSANGGNDWQIVVEGVAAVLGSYAWQTPEASTDQARIRIRETGGGTMAESGTFAIIERAPAGGALVHCGLSINRSRFRQDSDRSP